MAVSYLRAKSMDDPCCGEEWLGYDEDFVIKSLSKYAIMRLK
jgi:hypothetical protein